MIVTYKNKLPFLKIRFFPLNKSIRLISHLVIKNLILPSINYKILKIKLKDLFHILIHNLKKYKKF
jgi:hypothetical protein